MTGGPRIAIVDYGMGNRRSVQKAFEHVGAEPEITSDPDRLRSADGVVVPGVGAFPQAMANLRALGLDDAIRAAAADRTPVLGICLGMQLLFDSSTELGGADGLGLIAGQVTGLQTGGLRVPHIGWNDVVFERRSPLAADLAPEGCAFYHVHSFVARPADPADIAATAVYGERFATVVARGAVLGVQFHPEKSSAAGLTMLRNFVAICRAGDAAATVTARA
jgi:glutamine amidotransferase